MTNKQAYAGLLPCPFCGGEAKRFTIEEPGDNFGGDVICCQQCGASSHVEFGRKENLVSRWNTRPEAAEAISSLLKALLGPEADDGTMGRLGWLSALINDLKSAANTDRDDMVVFVMDDPAATWEAFAEVEALIRETRAALNSDAPLSIGEGL